MQLQPNTSRKPIVQPKLSPAFRFVKRAFDICSSACAIVILSPTLAVTAIAVKTTSPGPVIFKQQRFGRNQQPFTCYKFRSMKQDTDAHVPTSVMQEDMSVMTPVGPFIRKWSLASVIIGTPGDGESTKPLSHSTKTSLDQQFCERRPESVSCVYAHYTSPKFLSFGVLRGFSKGGNGAFARRNVHQDFKVKSSASNVGFALKSLDVLSSTSFGNGGRCSAIEAVAA